MKPYYEHAGITIYHGDCRDILPYLDPVDLVLTDPPFGVRGGTVGGQLGKNKKCQYSGKFTDNPEYISTVVVPVIVELILLSRCVIVTPGYRCMHLYPASDGFGCLYTKASAGLQRFGMSDSQPILYYGKSKHQGRHITPCSFSIRPDFTDSIPGFPCPKPLRTWEKLLNKEIRDVVIDPFMGSGTTLVAAKGLGRKAIGIEIEEKFCEIAVKRLAQEVLPFNKDSDR